MYPQRWMVSGHSATARQAQHLAANAKKSFIVTNFHLPALGLLLWGKDCFQPPSKSCMTHAFNLQGSVTGTSSHLCYIKHPSPALFLKCFATLKVCVHGRCFFVWTWDFWKHAQSLLRMLFSSEAFRGKCTFILQKAEHRKIYMVTLR